MLKNNTKVTTEYWFMSNHITTKAWLTICKYLEPFGLRLEIPQMIWFKWFWLRWFKILKRLEVETPKTKQTEPNSCHLLLILIELNLIWTCICWLISVEILHGGKCLLVIKSSSPQIRTWPCFLRISMTYDQYFRLGTLALLVLITKAYDIVSLNISPLCAWLE